MTPAFDPTENVDQWRAATRPQKITLSCGLIVQAEKASLLRLLARGKIPLTLAGRVESLINGEPLRFDVEGLRDNMPLIDAVAAACITSPPILLSVPAGQGVPSGSVVIDEIDEVDRLNLFSWAIEEVAPFAVFPVEESSHGNSPRPRGRAVRSTTE
jgi:hypothetical protein